MTRNAFTSTSAGADRSSERTPSNLRLPWHSLTIAQCLERVASSADGLSDNAAGERLARHGPNLLPVTPPVPWWTILTEQFKSVVVGLLLIASVLALFTGEVGDAVAIAAVLSLNVALGFSTELRARRAMEALHALEVRWATVVRSGRMREVDARTLVPGDVVALGAGQAVPADARILRSTELRAVEAALTGESVSVAKRGDHVLAAEASLPERENMLYLGTTVVTGSARALVIATGAETEVGRIGSLVGGIREQRTPLERRLDTLGRRLAIVAVIVAALIALIEAFHGLPLGDVVRTGIAIAIAAVPEGLPAVVTIAMAIGIHRMARRHALVRRLPTVESLGSATVVCTDKTGTLTTGEMTVTTLWIAGREIAVTGVGYAPEGAFLDGTLRLAVRDDPHVITALRIASLANRADLLRVGERWETRGDPTEAALLTVASKAGIDRAILLEQWPEAGELPFSSERMLMATYHRRPDGELVAHVKGSPPRVLELCERAVTIDGTVPLAPAEREHVLERNEELAGRGLRVLALAHGVVGDTGERDLRGLTFVGFAAMIDAPAPGVAETIARLRDAGIRTIMLTGDQHRTARAIAVQLGMMTGSEEALDGRDVDALSDTELQARVGHVAVYSRVSPEAKLRIVGALQRRGEIVAMLGDGVNDAAALKKADVGVAMGRRGSDVAKEVAGIVLEDDRFPTIAAAVEEGRVVFDNVRKFVFYLFSCNLAEIAVLLGAGVVGLPLPLLPLQILWLNLVTDTFPALALAFEPADADVMHRPPRDPHSGILSRDLLGATLGYALLIAAAALGAFVLGLVMASDSPRSAVTMAFMTLAFSQLFHLGNARSSEPVLSPRRAIANPLAIGAVALVVALQLLVVYLPPLRTLLGVVPLDLTQWAIVVALSLVPAVLGQTFGTMRSWRRQRASEKPSVDDQPKVGFYLGAG